MTTVEIIPTTLQHVLELRKTFREADIQEAVRMGIDPWKGSVRTFRFSCLARTGMIDNEPAAMWGIRGNLLGLVGQPYLLTSERVNLISPLRFTKIYIKEVQEMKKLFPVLENYVDASYTGAVRLLELSGFTMIPIRINDNEFYNFRMVS